MPQQVTLPGGITAETGVGVNGYDAQGNLGRVFTKPGDPSTQVLMTYDALGRVTIIQSKAGTEEYLLDDEGLRIRVKVRGTTNKYRYAIYNEARQLIAQYEKLGETGSLTWKRDILYVGTKEVAEVASDGKTRVTLCDHLGSPRFIWDGATTPIQQKFLPYGEPLHNTTMANQVAKGFTNHEQTDPSGLIYMQARFYLPMYGRFASPDPARDQHFEETQSWNIYSYVRNNPVMMTDPTGMVTNDEKKRKTAVAGGVVAAVGYLVARGMENPIQNQKSEHHVEEKKTWVGVEKKEIDTKIEGNTRTTTTTTTGDSFNGGLGANVTLRSVAGFERTQNVETFSGVTNTSVTTERNQGTLNFSGGITTTNAGAAFKATASEFGQTRTFGVQLGRLKLDFGGFGYTAGLGVRANLQLKWDGGKPVIQVGFKSGIGGSLKLVFPSFRLEGK